MPTSLLSLPLLDTCAFGWDIGLIGGVLALPSFQQYFGLDKESASARASLSGNIVSVLQAGGLCHHIKLVGEPIWQKAFAVGSAIQSIVGLGSTPAAGLKLLYFSRFLGGVGVGLMSALVPTYVSECAPRVIRGRCTGGIEVAVGLGNMLSFWVNYGVALHISPGEMQWRTPIIVQMLPGIIFFLFMLFQPESPRWLVERGRYTEAADALGYIVRKDSQDDAVQLTLSEIREEFADKRKLPITTQFKKMGENRIIALRCLIPSIATFFQQWTGTNAVNYYSPIIFANLGISSTTASLFATGIYGVVKFVVTCLVLAFVIESWGRKRTLIYGGLAQAITMIWIGGYSAVHPEPTVVPSTYSCPIAVGVTWLFTYVIAQITPIMLAHITYGTYLVFGVASVIMAIWVYVCIPETTGYPLEDVRYLFEKDIIIRSLQDAPGGRIFLGKRCAILCGGVEEKLLRMLTRNLRLVT
ncbi:hypothetical protein EDC04DRAFT_3002887 [Pisolithus marmoratus]|nr:hypothetical protein EDC04DRAFT_3002887 [Pisolithus marmoratus]